MALWYVDGGAAGLDTNPGTKALPWKSYEKLNKEIEAGTVKGGDTINLRGGVTPEGKNTALGACLVIKGVKGTAAKPLIVTSYGTGGRAKIAALVEAATRNNPGVYIESSEYVEFNNVEVNNTGNNDSNGKHEWTGNAGGKGEGHGVETPTTGTGAKHIIWRNCLFTGNWRNCRVGQGVDEAWTWEEVTTENCGIDNLATSLHTGAVQFPKNWLLKKCTFTNFAQAQVGEASAHGIYARFEKMTCEENVWEPSPNMKGQCISQRGPDFVVWKETFKVGIEQGAPYACFPYTTVGGTNTAEIPGSGTTLFAYNKCIDGAGSFAWYAPSDYNGVGECRESHVIVNNTFKCVGPTALINPDYRNAHGKFGEAAISGKITNTSKEVTALPASSERFVGYMVEGTGIPAKTTIAKVISTTAIELSLAATKTETTTLTIGIKGKINSNKTVNELAFEVLPGTVKWTIKTGKGIPGATTISSVGPEPFELTMSANATETGERAIVFERAEANAETLPKMSLTIENNLVVGKAGAALLYFVTFNEATALGTYAEDYNLWWTETGEPTFRVYSTEYANWAGFKHGSGKGGEHDVHAEPKINATTYIPETGSPCIDAGTQPVGGHGYSKGTGGLPFEYSGTAPDIGRYEFPSAETPPTLTNPGAQHTRIGEAVELALASSHATAFEATGLPAGLKINKFNGTITGTPTGPKGESTVLVTAEGEGTPATAEFTWTIEEETPPAEGAGGIAVAYRQQEVLQPGRYMLRHVAPKQGEEGGPGVRGPFGAGFAVLGQTLYANPLPLSHLPSSPDFHEGSFTLRLLDAGEFTASFPNRDASDGQPWRERFSAQGHTEFIEISREGEVETIGVIAKVDKDRQKVTLTGYDGVFLLKKAFEQDWTGVIGPRDMIDRYSCLPVLVIGDNWPSGFVTTPFEINSHNGTTGGASGVNEANPHGDGLRYQVIEPFKASGGKADADVATPEPGFNFIAGQPWRASLTWTALLAPTTETSQSVELEVLQAKSPFTTIKASLTTSFSGGTTALALGEGGFTVNLPNYVPVGTHTLALVSDGRWVSFYVDGQLINLVPDTIPNGLAKIRTFFTGIANSGKISTQEGVIRELLLRQNQPFLLRGAEKGDYALPGTAATYPQGGLHVRYQASADTSTGWYKRILAPDPRRPNFPEFTQTTEVPGDGNEKSPAVPPGVPTDHFVRRFFGAIWLPLSKGNMSMLVNPSDGCRVWVGRTAWGQQIIDSWEPAVWRNLTGTIDATALGKKDGWYPIIIEHFISEAAVHGVHFGLYLYPPVEYTDPGGTVVPTTGVIVPGTSLSPLGCVDARVQGSSFFDLVTETAKNFGYQLRFDPKTLESGEFPGQLVPKARVGFDTDEVIEPDDLDRRSGSNNYTLTEDATDSANSLRAFGSGIADGKGSQIAAEVVSYPDERAALFDMQAWVQAGDIAFPALLGGRAAAELALRLGAWQSITNEPLARDRLADTFPLTGSLAQFRWRPGDGVRLWLPDVNLRDTTPRQIMQVVRSIGPEGRMNTQIGFRNRPKDSVYALRQGIREATRQARSYQRQYVTRASPPLVANLPASTFTGYGEVALAPSERLVSAVVMITVNSTNQKLGVEINFVSRTSALGGPWTRTAAINVLEFAAPNNPGADNRMFVRVGNEAGSAETTVAAQLILTFLV